MRPFPLLPSRPSTLFFSEACSLTYTTAIPQPFAYQLLPHSFHRDGGCTPPTFKPADVSKCFRVIPFLFMFLRTLLHSRETQLFCFQAFPHSLPKTTRGGGRGLLLASHSSSELARRLGTRPSDVFVTGACSGPVEVLIPNLCSDFQLSTFDLPTSHNSRFIPLSPEAPFQA
jgi:hypothetical protein